MRPNRHALDEGSASRLLQGIVHPDDAPPGYGAVADLLNSAARLPLGAVSEEVAAATVSAMVEVIRDALVRTPEISRRKTMLGKLLAGKALAAVAVIGLTASGAAAATGSLPDPAQEVVSDALSKVGVDVPHPNHGKSAGHRKDKGHKGDDVPGDDQDQPADKPENNGQQTSTDAHNAKDAAKAAGTKVGPAVCAAVTDGKCQAGEDGSGSEDDGTASDDAPSGDHGKSGDDHGKPQDVPAKPTTPAGGVQTGSENSGKQVPVGKGKPDSDS